MIALDTDVLVHWLIHGSQFHETVRKLVEAEIKLGRKIALTPRVVYECLHVATDPKRFSVPLSISEGTTQLQEFWDAPEVYRIFPSADVLPRTLELLIEHSLGRKRILDTALAATLELAGIKRLATFNGRDFRIFPFLEVVDL